MNGSKAWPWLMLSLPLWGTALVACGGNDAGGGDGSGHMNSSIQALSCVPNELRACPCLGAIATPAMGTQLCDAAGSSFGACIGCPAHDVWPMAGSGAVGGSPDGGNAGASGMTGAGGMAGTTAGTDGGEPDGGAPGMPDASGPAPAGEVAPGVSCGVGLVTQCAPDTEKCCVRSLETDTCIGSAEACTCSLQDCDTLEVLCDGPEDCPDGQVCCGTLSANGAGYDSFVCATTCDGQGQQRVACHEQEPQCSGGYICANSQLLTNVQVCIDPATIQQ